MPCAIRATAVLKHSNERNAVVPAEDFLGEEMREWGNSAKA
jgi:hypothetical protein